MLFLRKELRKLMEIYEETFCTIVATNSYNGFPPVFYKIREMTIEDVSMWLQHGNESPAEVYSSKKISFIKQIFLVQIHWSKCCSKFNKHIL